MQASLSPVVHQLPTTTTTRHGRMPDRKQPILADPADSYPLLR